MQQFKEGAFAFVRQPFGQQEVHQQTDRVFPPLRHGAVGPHPMGGDPQEAVLRRRLDPLAAQRQAAPEFYQADRPLGNHVAGLPRLDIHHVPFELRGDELPLEEPLFAVADREQRVGGEAEEGLGLGRQIGAHVPHAGLLVAAHQRPQGVAKFDPALPEEFGQIHAVDQRALVVVRPPADQPVPPPLHPEGVERPALPGGHHVQMGDGGDMRLPLPGQVEPCLLYTSRCV